jgi:hypothetical protein
VFALVVSGRDREGQGVWDGSEGGVARQHAKEIAFWKERYQLLKAIRSEIEVNWHPSSPLKMSVSGRADGQYVVEPCQAACDLEGDE